MIEGPYIIPAGEAEVVKRRLSEARVWCLSRYKADDSRGSLRSPELRPELPFTIERRGADGDLKYDSLKTDERIALVNEVANRRSGLLANLGIACPDWSVAGGGELFVVQIDYSLWDGLPEDVSDGFFDSFDIPAWDTWVHLQRIGETDVLLCWVPNALMERVNEGIYVSCTDCLHWLDGLVFSQPKWQERRWFERSGRNNLCRIHLTPPTSTEKAARVHFFSTLTERWWTASTRTSSPGAKRSALLAWRSTSGAFTAAWE